MMPSFRRAATTLTLFCASCLVSSFAHATDRRFAFNYESGVLAPGQVEFEPWTTARLGREHHYAAFEQRLEFELGLVPNLQTSLYWNFAATSESVVDEATGSRVRTSSTRFQSLSSEWKYKLSDALSLIHI